MKQSIEMHNLYEHEINAYNLKDFQPQIVDANYLKQLGVTIERKEVTPGIGRAEAEPQVTL